VLPRGCLAGEPPIPWHNGSMATFLATNSPAFDIVLIAHIVIAVASLVIFVVTYGFTTQASTARASAKQFFGPGAQWPLRVIHLLPITGIALVLSSRHSISFSEPFVGIGLALWLAMSGVLEGMVMPSIRKTSVALVQGSIPEAQLLSRIKLGLDIAALCLVVAAIFMVAQPGS
jgi:hypothetical protein